MSFKNDVFISYRTLDNKPSVGQPGWVDNFFSELQRLLGEKLGRDAKIWFDREIRANEYFESVLVNELGQSGVFISILSPGYVNESSSWCRRELSEFCRLAKQNLGVRIGEKSRCIKVIKTFLPRDQHPDELKGIRGTEFYDEDAESGLRRSFSYLPGGYKYNRYQDKIDEVVADVAEVLEAMQHPQADTPADVQHTVYLAETTTDQEEHRDNIRNELISRGFRILPNREYGQTTAEYRQDVVTDLKQSRLSIHLIGARYGTRLEDDPDEKSIVQIQNELAAQQSAADANFARIIWIEPEVVAATKSQTAFLDLLRTDADAQRGAELLERPFEELKNRMIEKLIDHTLLQFPEQDQDLVRIYLICDKLDFSGALLVRDYLFDKDQQYEVILPPREGDSTQVIEDHKDILKVCDATLIYYGNGSEFWFRSKLMDLRKVTVWGRQRPLLCKGIYLAAPQEDYKEDLKTREALLLNPPGYDGLATSALENFVANLEAARTAQVRAESGGSR